MDSDNNAPCFPLAGLVWLSAARRQASRLMPLKLLQLLFFVSA